jgi:hypothetical protein
MPENALPKTKEEYLEYVRAKRGATAPSSNRDASQALRGTIQDHATSDKRNDGERADTSQSVHRRDGNNESGERDASGANSEPREHSRPLGRGDSSPDESTGRREGRSLYNDAKSVLRQFLPQETKKKSSTPEPKKLSETESFRLRPKLIATILWQSEHMDEFIKATTHGHRDVYIWSQIDNDDAEVIADYLIERGKQNGHVAKVVREVSTLLDKLKLGLIVAPKVYATIMVYIERGIGIR